LSSFFRISATGTLLSGYFVVIQEAERQCIVSRKKGREKNRESPILIYSLANRIGVVPVVVPVSYSP